MVTQREPRGDPGRDTLSCHTIVPPQPEYSTQGGPLHNGPKQFLPPMDLK